MDLMTPEGGTIVWTAVIFIALLVVLYKIAWKPILSMLEEREAKIQVSLLAADQARFDAEQSAVMRQQILDEAHKEAAKVLAEAQKAAKVQREEISKKAKEEADQLIDRAKREIKASQDQAVQDLRELAVNLSISATEKLIHTKLSRKDHNQAINDAMKQLENLN